MPALLKFVCISCGGKCRPYRITCADPIGKRANAFNSVIRITEVGHLRLKINKLFPRCVAILSDPLCNTGPVVKRKSDTGEGNNGSSLAITRRLPAKENTTLAHPIKFHTNMITPVLRSAMSSQRSAISRLSTVQRHLSTTSAARKVENLTVFGAGLMGAGIAQVGAQNGLKVGIRAYLRAIGG